MQKRGRKSQADLTAVKTVGALPQRPAPPKALDTAGAARWREIVNALPADYWRPSDLGMLEAIVRCEQNVALCDAAIEEHGMLIEGSTGSLVANPAIGARARELATIATLQTKLRLCPSSRYDKRAAKLGQATAAKRKPWEA